MQAQAPVDLITGHIIGAAIEVHRVLGPGLLESTYMPCLQFELATGKLRFVAERAVPTRYKGLELDAKYRIDLLVEDVVVVEVKSVDSAGLLINFNVFRLIDGVKRLVNPQVFGHSIVALE